MGDQAGFGAGPQLISRPYIEGVDLQVGNKTFSRQHVDVLDLKEVSRFLGEEIDGIIGSAIYRNYKVTLDYRRKSVTLIEDNRCQPAGKRLRMENGNTHFLIRATFKSDYEGIDGAFMVDSGAGPLTVVLNKRGSYLCHSDCLLLPAMGAPVLVRPLPSAKISFEGMEINVSKSYRFVQDSLALQESGAQGVIGGGVLRDFIVTFDWRNHSVFFQEIK